MEVDIKITPRNFQKNVERFARWNPKQAVQLQYLDVDAYHFCKSERGELNLVKEEEGVHYLHDQQGILKEAKEWFQSLDLSRSQVLYVYGVGLGYYYLAAKKWLQEDTSRHLVFLEDDLGVIARLLETTLGGEILRNKQVRLIFFHSVEKDHLPFHLLFWKFLGSSFKISAIKSYVKEKQEILDALCHKLLFEANVKNASLSEFLNFGAVFYHNFYHNLFELSKAYSGNALFGKFKEIPAIICGAGPSLEKQLPLLSKAGSRALIFGGGSSINALTANGIKPHFIAGIDPNEAQYERYLTNKAEGIPFFYRSRLNYKALLAVDGPRLYLRGAEGFKGIYFFEERLNIEGDEVDEGHNVINFLIDIARNLGCNPIIIAGLDLGYTEEKIYAPGVVAKRELTEESFKSSTMPGEEIILRTDIFGKPLKTLWKWIAEAKWIEEYSKHYSETAILNATEGGLGFGKVPLITLKEALQIHCQRSFDLDEKIEAEIFKKPLKADRKEIVALMKELEASLKNAFQLLKQLVAETRLLQNAEESDFSSGVAVLLETELVELDAFRYVLDDFNTAYNCLIQGEMDRFSHMRSEKKKIKEKLKLQIKKYRFLMNVVRANLLLIKKAYKHYGER